MAAIDKANELERIDPRSFTGSLHTLPLTSGEGVTWNCAVDDEISNQRPNCDPTWNGGDFGTASAAPVFGPHRAVRSKFGQSRE